MAGETVVGQMAINAFDATMRPGMDPILVFGLHHMAAGTKVRSSRTGIETWWTKTDKKPYRHRYQYRKAEHADGSSLS